MTHFLIVLTTILVGWSALSVLAAIGWAALRTWQKSRHHEGPTA